MISLIIISISNWWWGRPHALIHCLHGMVLGWFLSYITHLYREGLVYQGNQGCRSHMTTNMREWLAFKTFKHWPISLSHGIAIRLIEYGTSCCGHVTVTLFNTMPYIGIWHAFSFQHSHYIRASMGWDISAMSQIVTKWLKETRDCRLIIGLQHKVW